MSPRDQRTTLAIQSPLAFGPCLKAMRSILQAESFNIIPETFLAEIPDGHGGQARRRLALLVVWSASFAHQALSVDRDAGLLIPFCLFVLEDGTCSTVVAPHGICLALETAHVEIRVLAGVLETKIKQVFLEISAHGPVHNAVQQGGGIYRGIQYGSPEQGVPDLVLFDDPVTKTTLALKFDRSPVCPDAVRSKISDSRKLFTEAQLAGNGRRPPDGSWDVAGTPTSWAV